jgi:hypothetical protein
MRSMSWRLVSTTEWKTVRCTVFFVCAQCLSRRVTANRSTRVRAVYQPRMTERIAWQPGVRGSTMVACTTAIAQTGHCPGARGQPFADGHRSTRLPGALSPCGALHVSSQGLRWSSTTSSQLLRTFCTCTYVAGIVLMSAGSSALNPFGDRGLEWV